MKIYVAGAGGMVGAECMKALKSKYQIVGTNSQELDLLQFSNVDAYLATNKPDVIIVAAAKVGGGHKIFSQPTEFYEINSSIQTNVMRAAVKNNIKKVIFLASAAIYPASISTSIKETDLMKGELDTVQEPYGLAKLAGYYQSRYYNKEYNTKFVTVVPANLIGNRDNGQVVYSLMKQMFEAKANNHKAITLWGSGEQRREFIFIEDVVQALEILIDQYDSLTFDLYNVGMAKDISIKDLAVLIKKITGFQGELIFDKTKLEGVAKRLLNSERIIDLGYKPNDHLEVGLRNIYESKFLGCKAYV